MKLTNNTFKIIVWVILIIYIGIMAKVLIVKSSPRGIVESIKEVTVPEVERRIKQGSYIPLNTIGEYFSDEEVDGDKANEIAVNLLLYIPLGFLVPILMKSNRDFSNISMAIITFSITLSIVGILGGFEVFNIDWLILNTLGGIIGFLIYKVGAKLYKL